MAIINLHNEDWPHGVTVDVRRGNNSDPEQNFNMGTNRIALNDYWAIESPFNEDIYWRRDKDPSDPHDDWHVWNHESVFKDETYDVKVS